MEVTLLKAGSTAVASFSMFSAIAPGSCPRARLQTCNCGVGRYLPTNVGRETLCYLGVVGARRTRAFTLGMVALSMLLRRAAQFDSTTYRRTTGRGKPSPFVAQVHSDAAP